MEMKKQICKEDWDKGSFILILCHPSCTHANYQVIVGEQELSNSLAVGIT